MTVPEKLRNDTSTAALPGRKLNDGVRAEAGMVSRSWPQVRTVVVAGSCVAVIRRQIVRLQRKQ